ncbi:MAG: ABC transporter permease subunit [Gammaproteobacteria bacterium]|nr:ABC transporter permease subunit [Gammaproteobacteria bacterium]
MNGFVIALKSELFIARNTFSSKFILFAPAAFAILQSLLTWLTEVGTSTRNNLMSNSNFNDIVNLNAYGHFVDGMSTGLTILGLLVVAQAAYSFSYDRDTGIVRHILIRRASRPALILAKLFQINLLTIISIAILMITSYLISGFLWEFGAIIEDGFELISEEEILAEISMGLKLAIVPLPAAIAFGLFVSTIAQSATQAITTALGITLTIDIFKSMLGSYADYLYARFQPSLIDASYLQDVSRIVRGYSDVLVNADVLQLNLWAPLPAFVIFVSLTIFSIKRKNI